MSSTSVYQITIRTRPSTSIYIAGDILVEFIDFVGYDKTIEVCRIPDYDSKNIDKGWIYRDVKTAYGFLVKF